MILSELPLVCSIEELAAIPEGKCLIKTVNAWSYVLASRDESLAGILGGLDYLIPDGMSIVWACRFLKAASQPRRRIAGWDLFTFEMDRLNAAVEASSGVASGDAAPSGVASAGGAAVASGDAALSGVASGDAPGEIGADVPATEGGHRRGRVMFLGSSEEVLSRIRERCAADWPSLTIDTYSPPYRDEFSPEDSRAMVEAVNASDPDLLWIGMTAPKQEKWAYGHWDELDIHCHCGAVGAVFDFYAGTIRRAPVWMQNHGLEWLYRLVHEPRRMWRRYIIGNARFVCLVLSEKFGRLFRRDG